jgi:ATP-dependent Clp protease ATP-binding subunit ClpC
MPTPSDFFEHFTLSSRRVLVHANQAAVDYDHDVIDLHHMLLGLALEKNGLAARVMEILGANFETVFREMENCLIRGTKIVPLGKLPQTKDAKEVVRGAVEEARLSQCNYVGTQHLLLSLIRNASGITSKILHNLNLSYNDVQPISDRLSKEVPREP